MEVGSHDQMLGVVKNLDQHPGGLIVRNVPLRTMEQWAMARQCPVSVDAI